MGLRVRQVDDRAAAGPRGPRARLVQAVRGRRAPVPQPGDGCRVHRGRQGLQQVTTSSCFEPPELASNALYNDRRAAKKKRTALQSAFTGGEGAPGARVRASFDEVMQKLHFPEGQAREAAAQLAQTLPKSRLQEAFAEGRYYLLPSFIRLLFHLAESPSAEKVKLVFRTFGDDVPEVAAELELLADGRHPLAPGRKLHESFKLDVEPGCRSIATFYRDGFGADGTVLTVGSLTKVPFSTASQGDAFAAHDFYAALPNAPSVEVNRGFEPVKALIDRMLRDARTIALRDYWEWWSAHAEAGEYGKLLLVNTQPDADELAVFFDDHIEAHHSHIVDVRDLATGEPVPFEQAKGKYLQRVEPFAAVTDPDYFVALFEQIIARA